MYKAFVVDYHPKADKMAEELEQKANELPLVAGNRNKTSFCDVRNLKCQSSWSSMAGGASERLFLSGGFQE